MELNTSMDHGESYRKTLAEHSGKKARMRRMLLVEDLYAVLRRMHSLKSTDFNKGCLPVDFEMFYINTTSFS